METPRDPAASRFEHAAKGLRRSDLDRDPIKQFGNWFTAAIEAGIREYFRSCSSDKWKRHVILPLRVTNTRRKACAGAISIAIQSNNLETGSLPRLRPVFASTFGVVLLTNGNAT